MAVPSRRRDSSPSAEQTSILGGWDPLATQPWNAEPRAQLGMYSPFGGLLYLMSQWPNIQGVTEPGTSTPLGDLEEFDDAWLLQMELPGVKKDDVDIQLTGRRLVVRAERKQTERKGLLRRSTRTAGRYFLEVVLPSEVDPEGVEATLDEGVLTVRVPKPGANQGGTRRIAVS
jgi:HSP20 family protein